MPRAKRRTQLERLKARREVLARKVSVAQTRRDTAAAGLERAERNLGAAHADLWALDLAITSYASDVETVDAEAVYTIERIAEERLSVD